MAEELRRGGQFTDDGDGRPPTAGKSVPDVREIATPVQEDGMEISHTVKT